MTRKRIIFEKDTPYHVLSRAVERRKIFVTKQDCCRFVFQMYAANIGKSAPNLHRHDIIRAIRSILAGNEPSSNLIIVEHSPIVGFLSFALNVNHYHFEVVSNVIDGIPKYMQKLNGSYAKYFNLKYNRTGNLFEKPYKIISVKTGFQSDAVLRYINIINVLDVYQPGWREKGLKDENAALEFLKNYPFSSFPDLFGERNSLILAPESVLKKHLGDIVVNKIDLFKFAKSYLREKMISSSLLYLE